MDVRLRLRGSIAAISLLFIVGTLIFSTESHFALQVGPHRTSETRSRAVVSQNFGQLPLSFEPNHGQVQFDADYHAVGEGFEALLHKDGTTILTPFGAIRMRIVAVHPSIKVTLQQQLSGRSNYFIGRDSSRWRTNIPNYAQVEYASVYPGIDLRYHGTRRNLEYDFIVRPGAAPDVIKLSFSGERMRRISSTGDLILKSSRGDLIFHKPVAYQLTHTGRVNVDAQFRFDREGNLGFDVARFDHSAPLVIDPVVNYATYVGGVFAAPFNAMAIDAFGNAYITGAANAPYPTTTGAYQTTNKGGNDVFVTKLNADGTQLIYSTYVGGSLNDIGYAVAIDASGHAYVAGVTQSSDFPVLNTSFGGGTHVANSHVAFVFELTSDGANLVYSSYLGGTQTEFVNWITTDPKCTSNCNAYLGGGTQSADFPTTPNAYQSSLAGSEDAFVSKVAVVDGLATLTYSSFFGGTTFSAALAITVDGAGNAFITGNAGSGFPTNIGPAFAGDEDAYVAKIDTNASGSSSLVYSTYLGGSGRDQGEGIALPAGCVSDCAAYVTGMTSSADFPVTSGVVQSQLSGYEEAFVTQLSPSGTVTYSTFLGGFGLDYGQAVVVDSSGDAYVTLYGDSPNLAGINSVQTIPAPNGKLFKFSASGGSITQTGWPPVMAGSARSIARDTSTTPNTLYLGTNRTGIWKSTDDGVSFGATGLKDATVYALDVDKMAPSTVLAGTAMGLMATTDGGVSFASIAGGLPAGLPVYSIFGQPGLLLIGTEQGLFRSTDGAASFASASGVASSTQVYALTADSSAVYAGTGAGVFSSTDAGVSFAATNMNSNNVYAMVDDTTSTPSKVYAGTLFGGVIVSTDGFKSTTRGAGISLSPQAVFSLALDPNTSSPATVYAGVSNFLSGVIYASTDGGLTYAQVPPSSPQQNGVLNPIDVEAGTMGGASTIFGGVDDEFYAYLAELNPGATDILFSTYIGGTTSTVSQGLEVDPSGNIFISGYTASNDFPTTAGVFQNSLGMNAFYNGFVEKIGPAMPSPSATPTPNGAEISAPSLVTLRHVGIGNGKTGTGKLTISNTAKRGRLIGNVTNQTNPLFSLSASSFDLVAGRSTTIDVSCMPDELSDSGSITLVSNASNTPSMNVGLVCAGLSGKLSAPKELVLRSSGVGKTVSGNLVVKNEGRGVLTLSSNGAAPSPTFQGGGEPLGIAPGTSANIAIMFTPTQTGTVTGGIEVTAMPPSTGSKTVTLKGIAK